MQLNSQPAFARRHNFSGVLEEADHVPEQMVCSPSDFRVLELQHIGSGQTDFVESGFLGKVVMAL